MLPNVAPNPNDPRWVESFLAGLLNAYREAVANFEELAANGKLKDAHKRKFQIFRTRQVARGMMLAFGAPLDQREQGELNSIDEKLRGLIQKWPYRHWCWKCAEKTTLVETDCVRCMSCFKMICPVCRACEEDDACPDVEKPIASRDTFDPQLSKTK